MRQHERPPANPAALLIVRSTFSVFRPFREGERSFRKAIETAGEGGVSFSTLISGRAKVRKYLIGRSNVQSGILDGEHCSFPR